ncbi:hypothetical protein DSC45_02860 [Streptomyces sp. YIM 130001]|uniref:DUF4333 domain-containing protein n=1 Tax=Streptomyces sp. YIM 130001 TaxID=2259644 RepID=UPI000E65856C|nr:DUF4333 domain-containing protein [Streptomyces sp. YIM 130001]RII20762.1 hypothetical protein DSC45_02860 [Streptomyces sp. YIM 130001]
MQKSARSRGLGRIAAGVAGGALAALFAAGCSFSAGGAESVDKDEVAEQAASALGKKVGGNPDVTCPKDLKAEKGETVRCELTSGSQKFGVTVTAASVDGDKVKMDFKVDDTPAAGGEDSPAPSDPAQPTDTPSAGTGGDGQSVNRAEVARQGKAALAAQTGEQPDAFSCPQDLPAKVNATIRCQLSAEGKQYGVTVTATSVVNGKVKMNFKVDGTPAG